MEKELIVYGVHPVMEALNSGKQFEKLLLLKQNKSLVLQQIRNLAAKNGFTIQYVPVEKLNRITKGNHQGVVGFISAIDYVDIEKLLPGIFESGQTPLILIADRVTDVRNLGSIARTAECAGAHALVIPDKESAQVNSESVRSSAGALNRLPVSKSKDILKTVNYLKNSGLQIIACTEKASDLIYDVDFKLPSAVIMGSENAGISTALIAKADSIVKIPMPGKFNSLNVAVATGIVLFEACRQNIAG